MIDQLRKRLFVSLIVLGCLSYAIILALTPVGLIVWFLTRGN